MPSSLQVHQKVHDQLAHSKPSDAGYLVGFADSNAIIIAGCIASSSHDPSTTIDPLLPSPLHVIGTYSNNASKNPPSPSIITATTGASPQYTTTTNQQQTTPSFFTSLDDAFYTLRSILDIPSQSLDTVKSLLQDPNTVFLVQQGNNSSPLLANHQHTTLSSSTTNPLVFEPYINASSDSVSLSAPKMDVCGDIQSIIHTSLHLDVLYYLPKSTTTMTTLADVAQQCILPSLLTQLDTAQQQLQSNSNTITKSLRALHFHPPSFTHAITALYPVSWPSNESEEKALASKRKQLHQILGLPTDRPLLRVANAIDPGNLLTSSSQSSSSQQQQQSRNIKNSRLQNVHQGLPPSGIKNGSLHTVRGDYDYFHYMQDKFDDSGWGCAYRSLQTICSWFQKQHYTARAPPSHREIQTTLVSIGDKTQDFIGSKQWIGAIELGFILDSLLCVECKVITVSSGAEMPSKAREIAAHFDSQGTPIMIGGGVLAYTLLGIDYNGETGECAFLILDPHYTGVDEIGKIHSGQWIAWKRLGDKAAAGGDLFVKDAFYNLLCPQRPQSV